MTPHAFYQGLLRDMRTHLGEPKAFCAYPPCGKPFTPEPSVEYCSERCGEDHDTVQKGRTPLPEHERCTCAALEGMLPQPRHAGHFLDCPRYAPHPEDYTHPLENE